MKEIEESLNGTFLPDQRLFIFIWISILSLRNFVNIYLAVCIKIHFVTVIVTFNSLLSSDYKAKKKKSVGT